ncbi:hypothetical protein DMH15_12530 [Streptomyces sp. WAC 06725]|nr:hypothetical protein DMH15_12530 [Streptomyces sp. WAC 06725]
MAQGFLTALDVEERTEAEAVLLVVSELVTNAVRHAGGMTGFGLRAGPGTVTVTVADASRVPPQACPADPAQPGGFGWALVNHLARKVDVHIQPGGKTVSAVLPLAHTLTQRPERPGTDAAAAFSM